MENASKALIIAGAILLSILLISLGIMIFNQAQGTIKGAGMTEAQISAFNQKFTKYEGKQKGSSIRSLVQEVMANNNSEEASDETRVSINVNNPITTKVQCDPGYTSLVSLGAGAGQEPSFGRYQTKMFSNTLNYDVSFKYYNGRVIIIIIKPAQ